MTARTPEEMIATLGAHLVRVPAGQMGVCTACRSAVDGTFERCRKCTDAMTRFRRLPEVVPISLVVDRSIFHKVLRQYKDNVDPDERRTFTLHLATLLSAFLKQHAACIGPFDLVATIPSPQRDAMLAVVREVPELYEKHHPLVYQGSPLEFSADRYGTASVAGKRVLLVDDIFMTGASVYSAFACLTRSQAQVIGPVVLGRHIRPDSAPSVEMLRWLTEKPWQLEKCARCGGVPNPRLIRVQGRAGRPGTVAATPSANGRHRGRSTTTLTRWGKRAARSLGLKRK